MSNPYNNNKLLNYQSQTTLHKRYQSPNSGPSSYFMQSVKSPKNTTSAQPENSLAGSLGMTGSQSYSTSASQKPHSILLAGQQQYAPQMLQSQQNNLLSSPTQQSLSLNPNSVKGLTTKNSQSSGNVIASANANLQLGAMTYSDVNQHSQFQNHQRLKQPKNKSSNTFFGVGEQQQSHQQQSSLTANSYGGIAASHSASTSISNLYKSDKQQIAKPVAFDQKSHFSSQNPGSSSQQMRGNNPSQQLSKEMEATKSISNIPSSARVKTDYSVDRKQAELSYSSVNQYRNSSSLSQGQGNLYQNHGNTQSQMQIRQNQPQLAISSLDVYSSPRIQPKTAQATVQGLYLPQQYDNQTHSSKSQYNQSIEDPVVAASLRSQMKKHKSQQISEQLRTEPNQGEFQMTNLSIFIQYKSTRIGPISINATGQNVRWLTKQLLSEISMYEKIQLDGHTSQPSAIAREKDISNILHFQSYQHKNLSLSYYLTLPERQLDPLFNKQLLLEPFYKETKIEPINSVKPSQVTLKDFHFIKCVGLGGFSRVYLVQKKDSGKMYALKLIEKKFIQTNKKEVIVQNERNIMTLMQGHPFLLQLDYAFESNSYIAFAMEYCAGGEMFYHLRKIKKMTEEQARFYFIEICLGIDFLHERHIIYRDIKPENILLDIDGHIRIGDFGLSKPDMNDNEFAYSFCGSPEYMAPEMLLKVGHAYSVDHYTLGALLYELVTGLPPFYSQVTEEIYQSILNEELTFPDHAQISNELKDLLQGLLAKHPNDRLGVSHGTKEILSHPWCRRINIEDIIQKKLPTPLKIDVIGFNFDEEEFSKGETEFKAKLMANFYNEDFHNMFQGFYYESPSVIKAAKQAKIEQAQQKHKIQNVSQSIAQQGQQDHFKKIEISQPLSRDPNLMQSQTTGTNDSQQQQQSKVKSSESSTISSKQPSQSSVPYSKQLTEPSVTSSNKQVLTNQTQMNPKGVLRENKIGINIDQIVRMSVEDVMNLKVKEEQQQIMMKKKTNSNTNSFAASSSSNSSVLGQTTSTLKSSQQPNSNSLMDSYQTYQQNPGLVNGYDEQKAKAQQKSKSQQISVKQQPQTQSAQSNNNNQKNIYGTTSQPQSYLLKGDSPQTMRVPLQANNYMTSPTQQQNVNSMNSYYEVQKGKTSNTPSVDVLRKSESNLNPSSYTSNIYQNQVTQQQQIPHYQSVASLPKKNSLNMPPQAQSLLAQYQQSMRMKTEERQYDDYESTGKIDLPKRVLSPDMTQVRASYSSGISQDSNQQFSTRITNSAKSGTSSNSVLRNNSGMVVTQLENGTPVKNTAPNYYFQSMNIGQPQQYTDQSLNLTGGAASVSGILNPNTPQSTGNYGFLSNRTNWNQPGKNMVSQSNLRTAQQNIHPNTISLKNLSQPKTNISLSTRQNAQNPIPSQQHKTQIF